jgi:hypothetical protein
VAFYSLIYTADPGPALVELRRVLRRGAALLVAVHAGEGARRFDSYKGTPVDVELHLRSPDVLAGQVRAAGFAVESVEIRPPYPFEHASDRLYVTAQAVQERRPVRRGRSRGAPRDSRGRRRERSSGG